MSENYDDDSVWETYVPEVGGMYSEGAWRNRDESLFLRCGWIANSETTVEMPHNDIILYRRRKTEAKPEPADDGPKYETRVISLQVRTDDHDSSVWTTVSVANHGNGEFIRLNTIDGTPGRKPGSVGINPEEWPDLRAAIDRLIAECRE
jgi:hypothetical protein